LSLWVDDREINMEDGAENNLERELPPGENKKTGPGGGRYVEWEGRILCLPTVTVRRAGRPRG